MDGLIAGGAGCTQGFFEDEMEKRRDEDEMPHGERHAPPERKDAEPRAPAPPSERPKPQPGGGHQSESEKPSSPDSRWGGGKNARRAR